MSMIFIRFLTTVYQRYHILQILCEICCLCAKNLASYSKSVFTGYLGILQYAIAV